MFIDPDNPLAAEILHEAGQAYFAACKRMVAAVEALSAFDRAFGSSAGNREQARRRALLLDEAAQLCPFRSDPA